MKFSDVTWFLGEMAAYAAVVTWAVTRPLAVASRVALAIVAPAAFALAWGVFAAPRASMPLSGPAGVAFRATWLGLAALAAVAVVRRRRSPSPSPMNWS